MRAFLLAAIATFVIPQPGSCVTAPCSCRGAPGVSESVRSSNAVLFARVREIRDSSVHIKDGAINYPFRFATLEVIAAWKGVQTPTVNISVGEGSGECTFRFEQDKEYLIYARGGPTHLSATMCSRTRLGTEAAHDLIALGTPAVRWENGVPISRP